MDLTRDSTPSVTLELLPLTGHISGVDHVRIADFVETVDLTNETPPVDLTQDAFEYDSDSSKHLCEQDDDFQLIIHSTSTPR